jgi:hypothetical protein
LPDATTVYPGLAEHLGAVTEVDAPPTPNGAARLQPVESDIDREDWWSDDMVRDAGIPVADVPFVAVGGGIGSFVTVDYLRIGGVPKEDIRILSNLDRPWRTYEYLTRVSQIPRRERIRSDAASRPDNLWGFPSYALAEAVRNRDIRPLWQVLREPVFADFYTPRLGAVLEGIEREAHRIGYWDMLAMGQVTMVRRRRGGGYFTVMTVSEADGSTRRVAFRSWFVHLAVGYAGLKFLPDLQRFRDSATNFHRVVNAYEDHEHVYTALRHCPARVLVRGSGIVASRVLERLLNDRAEYGLYTEVVHLFRTFVEGPHGPHPWSRRNGGDGFAYQGFNYPKSVWGGQLKARARNSEGSRRAKLYDEMGGTNTAYRRHWQQQLRDGRHGGWYRSMSGTVDDVRQLDDGRLRVCVQDDGRPAEVVVDYIIDCTGLDGEISSHALLADMLAHTNAGRNPIGRLDVTRAFEVRGTASGDGRIYASGAPTLGGYFPGVDTFLGLQIAAQEIQEDLADRGFGRRIGPMRSLRQWIRWATNRPV